MTLVLNANAVTGTNGNMPVTGLLGGIGYPSRSAIAITQCVTYVDETVLTNKVVISWRTPYTPANGLQP